MQKQVLMPALIPSQFIVPKNARNRIFPSQNTMKAGHWLISEGDQVEVWLA